MLSALLDFGATVISSLIFFGLIFWISPNLMPENWRDRFTKDDETS